MHDTEKDLKEKKLKMTKEKLKMLAKAKGFNSNVVTLKN